ncbi:MAG TPA: putative capsular polysaccharide synthesis family protein [Clostridia bacterium]|nr:putative capsular polysaccharide synthesis family protein [Clostridia bacterium]
MKRKFSQLRRETKARLARKYNLLTRRVMFIYQMPKIGSQTVEATLQQAGFPHPIFRFHYLSATVSAPMREILKTKRGDEFWRRSAQRQLDHIEEITQIIRIRRRLRAVGFKIPKIEVITGVRDIIGLGLSSLFENHKLFVKDPKDMNVEICRASLLHPGTLTPLREWFDLEIKTFLDLDVFASPFPCGKGYTVYENGFARMLLYRFESLKALPTILSEFLGCPIPALENRNLGEAKNYNQQYHCAKQDLRLPADFVALQYRSKPMQHFYADAERQRFQRQWSRTEEPAVSQTVPASSVLASTAAP